MFTPSLELQRLGQLIDNVIEGRNSTKLGQLSRQLEKQIEGGAGAEKALLLYWQSNIFSALADISGENAHEYIERQLGALRQSISSDGFGRLRPHQRVQILTNLGIILCDQGRYPEAIEHFDKALIFEPGYALTHANRARCLIGYARIVNDGTAQQLLLHGACQSFSKASSDDAIFETEQQLATLKAVFSDRLRGIWSVVDHQACEQLLSDNDQTELGRSKLEREYRLFCLQNQLFLDPINDIHKHPLAAADTVSIVSIVKLIDESDAHPPIEFSIFNRIKQEYVTARYFYFDAINTIGVHFSDRNVSLSYTYDYTQHGLALEKLRMSYRYVYGVLDRIALLVNRYWSLGYTATQTSFSSVWYRRKGSKKLHSAIAGSENPTLLALYELSTDLHSKQRESLSAPDARMLADLRNALEHRFVEIVDDFAGIMSEYRDVPKSERVRIPVSVLEKKTLRMLKLARSACIYVAMAINFEEQVKQKKSDGLSVQNQPSNVHDSDKRRWS